MNKKTTRDHQKDSYLIVDDEPDMCWALQNLLTQNDIVSQRALNGQQAIALVEEIDFTAVFVDAKLPDMEGLDLAKHLRRSAPDLRIIMLSGYFYKDDPAIRKALDEKLLSGFIAKPFQNQEILRVLHGKKE